MAVDVMQGLALGDARPADPRTMAVTPGAAALDMSDEGAVVRRVQQGDTEAFDELVRRYMRRAYGLAYRLLGHREDAEDLVQDAFMTALQRIETFDVTRPFGPWFFRLLTNRGLNARQARFIRQVEPLAEERAGGQASPLDLLERTEVRERFRQAADALPERQRIAIELFDVEGFSSAEIAAALDIPAGTVRWYVHEARRALRSALEPLANDRGADHG
ncbi:MAG: sigma-70 family RNA polymerase sigma factor [Gemmatimonadales bacterium]|nr:sigma-70 family RNA polymerase sigma factor [Gemmatimonadales bacterium]